MRHPPSILILNMKQIRDLRIRLKHIWGAKVSMNKQVSQTMTGFRRIRDQEINTVVSTHECAAGDTSDTAQDETHLQFGGGSSVMSASSF